MEPQQQLKSPDPQARTAAAEALAAMGPDAAPAAVELVEACADVEAVRDPAVAALEELGLPPNDSLQRLTELVASDDSLVAYWAVTLLGRSGTAAKFSQEKLAAALTTHSDIAVQQRAAWALGRIEPDSPAVRIALDQAARSSDARLARLAKASLEQVPT